LDKSKACFRRLQNSPAAQTLVIADLALRQDLLAKTLSMAAQMDILGQYWGKFSNTLIQKISIDVPILQLQEEEILKL
jgi:hypothetical protein